MPSRTASTRSRRRLRSSWCAAHPSRSRVTLGARRLTRLLPACTLSRQQRQYEENPPQDAIKAAQAELAATKDVMVKSIDAVLSRGERIEILVDRTDEMSHQARAFRKRATVVRRKMWFKNVKVLFAVGFSAVVSPCSRVRSSPTC